MNKIINPKDPGPNMAPDSLYYDLYNRIVAAYQQWCMDELKDQIFMVDLNKVRYKVGEAANNILEAIKADFTVKGDKDESSKNKEN
jgi:hypothetical protein